MKAGYILTVLSVIVASLAGSAATADQQSTRLQHDIAAVIHDMAGRWAENTWPTIPADLWDQDEPMPMYLAEEQEGWLIGWDAVRDYFNPKHGAGFMQAADYQASDIQVRTVADDIAVATWNIYWQMKIRPSPPIAERLRATGIFRKTAAGWKFIHYAEAPKSPAVYIQELYRDRVSPEFRERITAIPPAN